MDCKVNGCPFIRPTYVVCPSICPVCFPDHSGVRLTHTYRTVVQVFLFFLSSFGQVVLQEKELHLQEQIADLEVRETSFAKSCDELRNSRF